MLEYSAIGRCDKVSGGDKNRMVIKYFKGDDCSGENVDSLPDDHVFAPMGSHPPAKGTVFKTGNTWTKCSDTVLEEKPDVFPGPTPPATSQSIPNTPKGQDSSSATGLATFAMAAAAIVATLY